MYLPLISRQLPHAYTGPHAVGAVELEVPIPRQSFGSFRLKEQTEDSDAGIVIDSLLCTIFYPCEEGTGSKKESMPWVPRPLAQTLNGYLRFAGREDSFLARWLTCECLFLVYSMV